MNEFEKARRTLLRRSVAGAGALGLGLLPTQGRAQMPGPGPALDAATPAIARLVCGSPPGGVLDGFCRRVAEHLQPGYSRSVIVENRTGGAGQIAVSSVKAAAPDGLTVLVTPMPQMGIFPYTYKKLPYDPVKDFAPVCMGATTELAFAVGPAVPATVRTVSDFAVWCRAHPALAVFGSPAAGSTSHFAGILAARAAGVDLAHVPYRGSTPAIMDLIGGQVTAACSPVGDFMQFASSGRCRILATTGRSRSQFAPDVPTFVELGFRDIVMNDWVGVFVPAKTAPIQIQRLSTHLRMALSNAEVVKALAEKGQLPAWSTPADLAAQLEADLQRWKPLIASIGFNADT